MVGVDVIEGWIVEAVEKEVASYTPTTAPSTAVPTQADDGADQGVLVDNVDGVTYEENKFTNIMLLTGRSIAKIGAGEKGSHSENEPQKVNSLLYTGVIYLYPT